MDAVRTHGNPVSRRHICVGVVAIEGLLRDPARDLDWLSVVRGGAYRAEHLVDVIHGGYHLREVRHAAREKQGGMFEDLRKSDAEGSDAGEMAMGRWAIQAAAKRVHRRRARRSTVHGSKRETVAVPVD